METSRETAVKQLKWIHSLIDYDKLQPEGLSGWKNKKKFFLCLLYGCIDIPISLKSIN